MMRTKLYFPLAVLAMLLKPVYAEPVAVENPIDTTLQKQIQVFPKENTLDNYLIELSRSSGINVLVDATAIPQDSRLTPYPGTATFSAGLQGKYADKWGASLQNVMGDVAQQNSLTHVFDGKRTFLLWPEPDLPELARLLAEAESANSVKAPPGIFDTGRALSKYFIEAEKWDGLSKNVDIKIAITDLPQGLRNGILNEARAYLLGRIFSRKTHSSTYLDKNKEVKKTEEESTVLEASPASWFDEKFWQVAYLKVGAGQIGLEANRRFPILFVGGYPATADDRDIHPLYMNFSPIDAQLLAFNGRPRFGNNIVPRLQPVAFSPDVKPDSDAQVTKQKDVAKNSPVISAPTFRTQISLDSRWVAEMMKSLQLNDDPALTQTVTLQVKHATLQSVLADLEKQSGVKLSCDKSIMADKILVTGGIAETPLAEVLNLLTRLYFVKWHKIDDKTYIMEAANLSELDHKIFQLGAAHWYRYRFKTPPVRDEIKSQDLDLANTIVNSVDVGALRSANGVRVSEIPADLQDKLKQRIQERVGYQLIDSYMREKEVFSQQLFLCCSTGKTSKKLAPGTYYMMSKNESKPRLTLCTAKDEIVTALFPGFRLTGLDKKPTERKNRQ